MSNWNYVREERAHIGAGDHRFEVISAEEKMSSTNKRMIVVELKPNKATFTVRNHFVAGEKFNKYVTEFLDSCGIEDGKDGDLHPITWVGATGAARFKEGTSGYLEVWYFLDPKRAEKLPPWEGEMPKRQTVTTLESDEPKDDDLPF